MTPAELQDIEFHERVNDSLTSVPKLREMAQELRAARQLQKAYFHKLSANNSETHSNLLQLSEHVCSLSHRAEGMAEALANISSRAEMFKGHLASMTDRVQLLQERISAQSERVSGLSERSSILGDRISELSQKLLALNVTERNNFSVDDGQRSLHLGAGETSHDEEDILMRPRSSDSKNLSANDGRRGAGYQGQFDRRQAKTSFLGARGREVFKLRNRTGFKAQGQRGGRSHMSGSGRSFGGSSRRLLERDSRRNVHKQLPRRDQGNSKSLHRSFNIDRPIPRPDSIGMDNVGVIEID